MARHKYIISFLSIFFTAGCCREKSAIQNTAYSSGMSITAFEAVRTGDSLAHVLDNLGIPFTVSYTGSDGYPETRYLSGPAIVDMALKSNYPIILQYSAPLRKANDCFMDYEIEVKSSVVIRKGKSICDD